MKNIKNFLNFKNLNSQDIFVSIKNNNVKSVKNYIDSGYDLDIKNEYGYTALIWATYNNKIEIVKLLLNAGADVDKQNAYGETPLICAASNDNREMVELLLDYHADEFILTNNDDSFYDYLTDENKQYFLKEYPNKVYNAIYHDYKKSFTEFVKDYKIKNFY